MLKRRLSQVLGAIGKGYAVDTLQGGFPVAQYNREYGSADADGILASTALTAAAQEITAGISDPATGEFRGLSVTGNQASVYGSVSILGRDWAGRKIDEVIIASGIGTILGDKPFKYVDKIDLPVLVGAGDEISVGFSDKMGLKRPIKNLTNVLGIEIKASGDSEFTESPASPTIDAENGTILLDVALVDEDSFKLFYDTEIF